MKIIMMFYKNSKTNKKIKLKINLHKLMIIMKALIYTICIIKFNTRRHCVKSLFIFNQILLLNHSIINLILIFNSMIFSLIKNITVLF